MPELSLKLYGLVRDQGRLTVAEAARYARKPQHH